MALGLLYSTLCLALFVAALAARNMGLFGRRNQFPVRGRTIIVTGASQGMGAAVARLLAEKGASVVLVARNVERLREATAQATAAALDASAQRFHFISAELSKAKECERVLAETVAWNGGQPPDTVWCCAGASTPTLFVETSTDTLESQMNTNYFTSAYMAHATLRTWLKPASISDREDKPTSSGTATGPDTHASSSTRHIIFTSSFAGLFTFTGYGPYSPAKWALRGLADTLSMEVDLYRGSSGPIAIHTVFPATIISAGLEAENLVKCDLTKKLEEGDSGQTPAEVAKVALAGLERGDEMIPTSLLTGLVMRSVLGASHRSGLGIWDTFLSWIMSVVIIFVRWDMDGTTRKWGRQFGPSGMKPS